MNELFLKSLLVLSDCLRGVKVFFLNPLVLSSGLTFPSDEKLGDELGSQRPGPDIQLPAYHPSCFPFQDGRSSPIEKVLTTFGKQRKGCLERSGASDPNDECYNPSQSCTNTDPEAAESAHSDLESNVLPLCRSVKCVIGSKLTVCPGVRASKKLVDWVYLGERCGIKRKEQYSSRRPPINKTTSTRRIIFNL
jgi:hypothetical protein